jgi:hypothetical protein
VFPANAAGNVEQMIQKHVHRGFRSPAAEVLRHKGDHHYPSIGRDQIQHRVWYIPRTVEHRSGIAVREDDRRYRTGQRLRGSLL